MGRGPRAGRTWVGAREPLATATFAFYSLASVLHFALLRGRRLLDVTAVTPGVAPWFLLRFLVSRRVPAVLLGLLKLEGATAGWWPRPVGRSQISRLLREDLQNIFTVCNLPPGVGEVSFFTSLWNHPFFTISCITLIGLFFAGIHKRVVAPSICSMSNCISRIQYVL
eukprot:XP_022267236.1 nuclear envelope phosphatase-regulatory subunit 1 isoform X2 [Canis lupus familiaris]